MVRFLIGAFVGLILIGAMLVAWTFVFPLEEKQREPTPAVTPAPAPEPEAAVEPKKRIETQVVAPLIKTDIKEVNAEAVVPMLQSAALDVPEIKPLPVPELSAAQVAAAQAALQSQVATANSSARPTPVVLEDSATVPGAINATAQPSDVTPAPAAKNANYGALWDDLMQRCYAVVAQQQPMDENGLTVHGEERVRYAQPDTEQKWFSAAKAFSVEVKTRKGYGGPDVLRTCILKPNRFAKVDKRGMGKLKERFHDWWARERLAQGTVDQEYPYTLDKRHRWYGGLTRFGSAQGCPLKVEFSEITIAGDMEITFFLTESDKEGCDLTPGSGSGPGGAVRVNRLPQSGN